LVLPALVVGAMAGRAAMPGVVLLSSPARSGGLAASLGRLSRPRVYLGWIMALLLALVAMHGHHLTRVAVVVVVVVLAMAALGRRTLGGYTGDTLGATEQLTEAVVLLSLAASIG